MRWMVDRALAKEAARRGTEVEAEGDISSGSLYASGLIAAGGIVGLLGVCAELAKGLSEARGGHWHIFQFTRQNPLYQDWVAVAMFGLLAFSLYYFARKPLNQLKG